MAKIYKDNVILSVDEKQVDEYKKRGFKVVGEKEVKEDVKTSEKIKDLEKQIKTLESEKAELETKVKTLESEKVELEKKITK